MDLIPNARRLRRDATEAEKRLWQLLRKRRMKGWKFVRQYPVGPYIADFACYAAKLVIELDGGQHAERVAADNVRTAYLRQRGWEVMRFWNSEMLDEPVSVAQRIAEMLDLVGDWRR